MNTQKTHIFDFDLEVPSTCSKQKCTKALVGPSIILYTSPVIVKWYT